MPGTGIVDGDEGSRDKTGMQNRAILLGERLEVSGEPPHELPHRDLDADAI